MSDLISKRRAIELILSGKLDPEDSLVECVEECNSMLDWAADEIEALPTADVVEVVRCKDCKWFEREQPGMVYCPNIVGSWVEDDFFCKWGERIEDGRVPEN